MKSLRCNSTIIRIELMRRLENGIVFERLISPLNDSLTLERHCANSDDYIVWCKERVLLNGGLP